MALEIEPTELGFRRPFDQEIGETLRIKNKSTSPVAFKVKTTAPKQYCVRPNSGRVEPGSHVDVSVILQPMKQDPPADAKCRDKFLVQAVSISPDQDLLDVPHIMDAADKSMIKEQKIRVLWLSALGQLQTPNRQLASERDDTPETAPQQRFASQEPSSPLPPAPVVSSPVDQKAQHQEAPPALTEKPVERIKQEAATVAATVGSTAIEAKEAAIGAVRNRGLASESKRESGSGNDESEVAKRDPPAYESAVAMQARHATEGVPVSIVALLCLLSFLLAYFFF